MKSKRNFRILISALSILILLISVLAVTVFAGQTEQKEDATVKIKEAFNGKYLVGSTKTLNSDGYIGIPVEITTYYDAATHGASKAGYNGTPLIIYVVNANVERIGAKSDVEIISSMLGRGYIVTVVDYKNNEKAKSPDLDWSTQTLRQQIMKGAYFTNTASCPKGTYYDTILLPAGYDVSLGNVFWEADKHGADGTLEKVVENWNTDFRGWFKDTVIYWRDANGEKKPTQKGLDGSDPVWYSDSKGTVAVDANSADAKYVKATHTLAEHITDCVGPDGKPIDLSLYMHVVYPTTTKENPIDEVPVIALASSSEYLSNGLNTADRPQFSGFLFNGYAGVIFDYLYQPMAQSDYYGYYDGRTDKGALTGDRMNYGLHLYNDKRINTAAMRYIRYLTITKPETYSFNTDAIGVYGNSKGGWFTFLGEAELRGATAVSENETLAEAMDNRINSYTSKRVFKDHHDETYYDNGKTTDYTKRGVTIDGGEIQPWLTYTDKNGTEREIPSYASWIYASNGSNDEDITAGHAPIFAALHMRDDFGPISNAFGEITGKLDIPSFYVVVDLGHTFAYGPEYHHGYDTYQAMHDFANYYLRGDAVKVIYTDPAAPSSNMSATQPITIKFSGAVPASEIEKITLAASGETAVGGTWTSVRGDTEWTFRPDALDGGKEYILTVPAGFAGDNGKQISKAYTMSFFTEGEESADMTEYTGANGTYYVFNKTSATFADATVRFKVTNDAANVMGLYAVSNFNKTAPDSSTVGSLIGTVNLTGAGYYEIDATEYVAASAEGEVALLLKAEKSEATKVSEKSFATATTGLSKGAYVTMGTSTAPDGTAATRFTVTTNKGQYGYEEMYQNLSTAFSYNNIFGSSNITNADLGRKYKVTIKLYDTTQRVVQVYLNGAYTNTNGVHDFERMLANYKTTADGWTEISFDYTVYEPEYGSTALAKKNLGVKIATDGNYESPMYLKSIEVTEYVTDVELGGAEMVLGERGNSYKSSTSSAAFSIGSKTYNTLAEALGAAKSGDTVVMLKNYTMTSSDSFGGLGALEALTLDLGGYRIMANGSSLIRANATSVAVPKTTVTVKDGSVYLSDAPLVSYTGSTAAGEGKKFNINLDGLYILNTNGSHLSAFMSADKLEAAASTSVNINLINSTVDFRNEENTTEPFTLFSNGAGNLAVNYSVTGGEIKLDNLELVKLYDSFKKVVFNPDTNGDYTKLVIPAGVLGVDGVYAMRNDAIGSFVKKSVTNNAATYSPETTALSTKYGLIPETYASAEDYPFVMFDENGTFKGAYSAFIGTGDNGTGGVLGAAKNYVVNAWDGVSYGANPKEAFIVMRRNYTFDASRDAKFANFAQLQGTINIDLGGFTLSSGTVEYPIFPAFSKGFSGAAGNKIFPSTVIVNNGTIRHYRNGVVAMSTWDSVGGGTIKDKDFNFIFNNVTLGFVEDAKAAGLVAHGLDKTGTPGAAAPFNFTYNDCTFDVRSQNTPTNPVLFALSTTVGKYIKLTATVNGGKILANDPSKVTVVLTSTSDMYGSSITFDKGSDGEYLSYYVPTGNKVSIGSYDSVNDGNVGFMFSKTVGTDDVYVLAKNPLYTEYGMITETYKSADSYPFVVFTNDGACVGGYATLKAAVSAAKGKNAVNVWDKAKQTFGSSAVSTTVLLRRDYIVTSADSYNDYGQTKGYMTIDLNGHTLTQGSGAEGIFTKIVSKDWSDAVFPSFFTVKNGKILVLDKSVNKCWTWQTVSGGAMAEKRFVWDYENVTFGFAEGATSTNMLVEYNAVQDPSGYPPDTVVPFIFNYTDCTFDLATNAPSAKVTLFNAAPGSDYWLKSAVTVTGGKIIGKNFSNINLYSLEAVNGSSFKFAKGNGGYTELTVVPGGTAPATSVMPTDKAGTFKFAKTYKDGANTVYTLINTVTEYGTIPDAYLSVLDYPFMVFDSNGKCHNGFGQLMGSQSGAIGKAIYTVLQPANTYNPATGKYNDNALTAIILMRRDYTLGKGEYHNNISHAQGLVVIDLGGYTLYQDTGATKPMFDSTAKGWTGSDDGNKVFPSSYLFKNGEIKIYSQPILKLLCNDSLGGNAIAVKRLSWQFDNVKFGLIKGATATSLITFIETASTTSGVAPMPLIFDDCTFDFESVAPTAKITVFNFAFVTNNYIDCDAVIKGGKLYAASLSNITLLQKSSSHSSSVIFEKNSDGEMFTVYLAGGAAYPDYKVIFPIEDGEATLTYKTNADGKDVYTLVASEKTKYGYIPAKFASVENYPFAVFKNGNFVVATKLFGKDASESALHNSKDAGSVVLLRRDFTYKEDKRYSNLSQTQSVTIDLGGHVFTSMMSEMFYAQKKTAHDTTVTVTNGTILVGNGPVVMFSSWAKDGAYAGGDNFNLVFNGVTFGVADGAKPSVLIASAARNIPECLEYGFITLNGCTIDLTGALSTTLFDLADPSGIIRVQAAVNGGKIIADSFDGITVYNLEKNNTFEFGKLDGEYTKLYLPNGVGAPKASFNTNKGEKMFIRTGTEGSYVVYELGDESLSSFIVKSSVSLYSDFVFNVYVPARSNITSLVFDGKTVKLEELTPTDVEGADYYKLTKEIPANMAAESFKLLVELTLSDGTKPTATWTFSVPAYASLVLEDKKTTDTEKTLVKDMLSYIVAAYEYAKASNAADVRATVESIIGDTYTGSILPEDMNVYNSLDGVSLASMELGAKPGFVFYPDVNDDGTLKYDTDKYVFTQGGRRLEAEALVDGDGKTYIKVLNYAYGICEDVQYSISGTEISGTYNIKSYYEYAKTQNNAALKSLVEWIWRYSVSAAEYRAKVTSK